MRSMPMNACTVSNERTFSNVAASASSNGTRTAATIAVSCSLAAGLAARRRRRLFLFEDVRVAVAGSHGLLRRDGDLLGRDFARDDGHVDLLGVALASDEDRRARFERAAEDEVGERIFDHALDRAAQRPGAHGGVVALLDEQLLRDR